MVRMMSEEKVYAFTGLSSDTKPINKSARVSKHTIYGGSTFFEIDTNKKFMFNEDENEWVEIQ